MEHEKKRETGLLYESLACYGKSDFYPYHMPGHKRNGIIEGFSEFFQIDITEIDGFDNLHQAEGIIGQAQERAAGLYGADETYFLVNGSTCGILAAVSAATEKQDTILIARNCHKSVYHAALIQELNVKYLYPGRIAAFDIADAVNPEAVKAALEQFPECRAVVITSPTYEGLIADIRETARIVHEKDKILIVDEAHGAHLGLAQGMPENAVRQGADIVIHSLHKTLPSMTQTALLHVNGQRINRLKLRQYLKIYQSSSPSYVLMAGMDACLSYIRENAACRFALLRRHYENFMDQMKKCKHIRIGSFGAVRENGYSLTAWDICKLVISVKGTLLSAGPAESPAGREALMSGQILYETLRDEFHLQMEMAAGSYVLAIMTIADEEEGWRRLAEALLQIDKRLEPGQTEDMGAGAEEADLPPAVKLTISQAFQAAANGSRRVPLKLAAGSISGDFICLYPPGIPLLVPGEVIEERIIAQIGESLRLGLTVQGISDDGTLIIC